MRDRRQNPRVTGSRSVRRRERAPAWWEGFSLDTLIAYLITGIVSLALFWLLAQVALDIALVLLFFVVGIVAAFFFLKRRRASAN